MRGPHVQALHLGVAVEERAQRHAARGPSGEEREHEAAARRRVVAGKGRELGVESLEAQAHAEPTLVFQEELAAGRDLLGRARSDQLEASRGSFRT